MLQNKFIFFAPLFVLLGVCVLLIAGLNQDPKKIASALIDKPVPEFYQANLHESSQIVSPKDFPKQPFLLNVWGSWCGYCKEEHPLLIEIAKNLPIVGVDYRDNPQNGIEMLNKQGAAYYTIDGERIEKFPKISYSLCGTVYERRYSLKKDPEKSEHPHYMLYGFGGFASDFEAEKRNYLSDRTTDETLSFIDGSRYFV